MVPMASSAAVTLGIMIWAVTLIVDSCRRAWPAAGSSFSSSAAVASWFGGRDPAGVRAASWRRRLTVSVMSSLATPANWPARLVLKASWSNVASVAAIVKVELTTGL